MSTTNRPTPIALMTAALVVGGCASAGRELAPQLEALPVAEAAGPKPRLVEDLFGRDHAGSISEEALRRVLEAPVVLEPASRLGVVPVRSAYAPDGTLPLDGVPRVLSEAAQATGLFEAVTEVSTEWPNHGLIPGLRELAARYRAEYLLLYRHRFEKQTWWNPWAWSWVTVVGGLVAPLETVESAGVLEATLFDVRSGTILFTAYERISGRSDETVWGTDRKVRALQERLLDEAAQHLAEQVIGKVRMLSEDTAVAGPAPTRRTPTATPAAPPLPPVAPPSAPETTVAGSPPT